MKQLFPKDILEFTVDVHRFRHRKKSIAVYAVLLLFLSASFLALPFIRIPLYISARGLIKPEKERSQLQIIQGGQITFNALVNNKRVQKGDTLLRLNSIKLRLRKMALVTEIETMKSWISDCEILVRDDHIDPQHLTSTLHQMEAIRHQQQSHAHKIQIRKHRRETDRSSKLLEKGVIARAEFERYQYAYHVALAEFKQFQKQQQNAWQLELERYRTKLQQQRQEVEELKENIAQSVLLAPVSGTLLNVTSLENGSFLSAGTILAELSPDAKLIAECYVAPGKIGLIHEKNPVRFQIDAFDHNQWGQATGKILEVSRDVEFYQDQPVFRIRGAIREEYLALQNGYQGYLRKGMTFTAHIRLTERSLFDLLHDRWHDWLDPNVSN